MILNWDQYFMGVASLSRLRSKDPNTQVGACIVNAHKRIIGIGYNGFPFGVDDATFPWTQEGAFLTSKYAYVVHAEANAILNATADLRGSSLYVNLFPCNECAKLIIQAGIKEVVYSSDKYADKDFTIASKKMFAAAGVTTRQIPEVDVSIQL
jgi:dCMP deaminase